MTGLQPPAVPDFRPLPAVGSLPALFNSLIKDPLTFLESKVVFRARKTAAWNLNSGVANRYVPWDIADTDNYSGWSFPADTGGGGSTTLGGSTAVGAATFTVASAANLAIGDYLRIGPAGANREYVQIQNLAGTTVTPGVPGGAATPLALAHTVGDAVVEITSDPSVYVCQAPGWHLASANLTSSSATVAAQVFIPGIAVNEASPIGIGTNAWEGQEVFQAAAAVLHGATGVWEFYANAGDRIRLNWFMSSETASIAVDTTNQTRLTLVWTGV